MRNTSPLLCELRISFSIFHNMFHNNPLLHPPRVRHERKRPLTALAPDRPWRASRGDEGRQSVRSVPSYRLRSFRSSGLETRDFAIDRPFRLFPSKPPGAKASPVPKPSVVNVRGWVRPHVDIRRAKIRRPRERQFAAALTAWPPPPTRGDKGLYWLIQAAAVFATHGSQCCKLGLAPIEIEQGSRSSG